MCEHTLVIYSALVALVLPLLCAQRTHELKFQLTCRATTTLPDGRRVVRRSSYPRHLPCCSISKATLERSWPSARVAPLARFLSLCPPISLHQSLTRCRRQTNSHHTGEQHQTEAMMKSCALTAADDHSMDGKMFTTFMYDEFPAAQVLCGDRLVGCKQQTIDTESWRRCAVPTEETHNAT